MKSMIATIGLMRAAQAASAQVVHDAEDYTLEAQNGARCQAEDAQLAERPDPGLGEGQ